MDRAGYPLDCVLAELEERGEKQIDLFEIRSRKGVLDAFDFRVLCIRNSNGDSIPRIIFSVFKSSAQ